MIYVCIRCRFHYGPVAQVRSFQEQRGDLIKLSLITGHTGSERESRERKGEKRKKREIEEAYLQSGHTHLTHRGSTLQSASKTTADHRQAFT